MRGRTASVPDLRCEVCGQLPRGRRTRVTTAQIAAILPIELALHALAVSADLPWLLTVVMLAVTVTVLGVFVTEPGAARMFRRWIHAPALRHHRRIGEAPALWRARARLRDEPGALGRVTRQLARLDVNVLTIRVHVGEMEVLDELVLSAPSDVSDDDLVDALRAGGGRSAHVWPTTALALADGQTKALSLAARLAVDPEELPLVVAELLGAAIVPRAATTLLQDGWNEGTLLKIPSPGRGPLLFSRPEEPFTLAESARAARLAELAEILELTSASRDDRPPRPRSTPTPSEL
jgi:hypothetical protein